MNEQLQQALAQIIEKSMSGLDKTVDFLSAEVPDVVHQLLLWYGVKSAITGVMGFLIILSCFLWFKMCLKKPEDGKSNTWWEWKDYSESHGPEAIMMFNLFLVIPIMFGLALFDNLMVALQIWIAPKLWLIEYASSLVK